MGFFFGWGEEGGEQETGVQRSTFSGFLVAQTITSLPAMQETRIRSWGWEDPLASR